MTDTDRLAAIRTNFVAGAETPWGDVAFLLSLLDKQPAKAPAGTVRVRAMCAIDASGKWCITGWPGASEEEESQVVLDMLDSLEATAIHWIEADCQLPTPQRIEGTVVDG